MIPTLYSGSLYANWRIGLLGGSFNPAHEGHVAISKHALKRLGLDEIWWLVSPQNPLKPGKGMAPFKERLAQARVVTRMIPRLKVADIEDRLGTRYTVDTIEKLQKRMPETHFVWLMGLDNLQTVDRWRRWETLFERVPIAVFRRPGYASGRATSKASKRFVRACLPHQAAPFLVYKKPPAWLVLDNPHNPISATQLRQQQNERKG